MVGRGLDIDASAHVLCPFFISLLKYLNTRIYHLRAKYCAEIPRIKSTTDKDKMRQSDLRLVSM